MPSRRLPTTAAELFEQYDAGIRDFSDVELQRAEFESLHLEDVDFSRADLTETMFSDVSLERVCLDDATLTHHESRPRRQ